MDEKYHPIAVLLSAFGLSSFAGIATLLRGNQVISLRVVLGAFLYSGLSGLVVALIWFRYFDENGNIYFLLGVSALAGAGGTSVIDCLLQVFLRAVRTGDLGGPIRSVPDSKKEDDHAPPTQP